MASTEGAVITQHTNKCGEAGGVGGRVGKREGVGPLIIRDFPVASEVKGALRVLQVSRPASILIVGFTEHLAVSVLSVSSDRRYYAGSCVIFPGKEV